MPDFTSSDKVVEATSTHLCMDESTDILNKIATQIAIVHDRPTMVTASTWASTIGLLVVTTSALGCLGLVVAAARARAWRARAAVRVQAAARGYLLRRAARFFYCAAWNIQRKWRARARCSRDGTRATASRSTSSRPRGRRSCTGRRWSPHTWGTRRGGSRVSRPHCRTRRA